MFICSVKIAMILPFFIFYLIYTLRRGIQNILDQKKIQNTYHLGKENTQATNSPKNFFNNQPFNPEVCNVKIFVIVATVFTFIIVMGTIIALTVESKFHIFQMFGRFFLSVVIPLIVYINNSDLRTFVIEMFQ